jgi:hypothetical protein
MKQGLDQHIACKPAGPQARVPSIAASAGEVESRLAARIYA